MTKIGVTFSAFDLLHAGHILMLEEAKQHCDYLVACLQIDPNNEREYKNKPVQSLQERRIQLEAVKYVDKIIVYSQEDEIIEILQTLRPDVRIIGEEYRFKDFTGKDWCAENGIEIYYNSRNHPYSSTSLRERVRIAERKTK